MIYEYINGAIGVQARAIFDSELSLPNSIRVISRRGLRKKVERGQIKKLRNPGPGTPAVLDYNSLPYEWKKLLIKEIGEPEPMAKISLFEQNYSEDPEALSFFSTHRLKDGNLLPDDIVNEYVLNAQTLDAVGRVYRARYNYRKKLKQPVTGELDGKTLDIWEITTDECNRFRGKVPHTLPGNKDRLRVKYNEYKKTGYSCLIHKNFCNNTARKVFDDTVELLNSMFADNIYKPTRAEISRRYDGFLNGYVEVINNETGELYDPKLFKKLSTATITNYLAKWTNKSATYAIRSGDRQKLMGKFRPYHTLIQPSKANSIISVDDRQPPFEYAKGERAWFYCAVDLGSEAVTAWVWGMKKEGIILDFYRQLVRGYTEWGLNLPAEIECESSLNSSFKDTFLREGAMFQYVRIEANNARAKRIENYWGQFRYGIEKMREGWIARPYALSEANQKGPVAIPQIPYDTIINNCLQDIERWNNSEHSKIKGKTRWEVFMETQNPDVKPTNWRAILPSLGYKTETSCRAGIMRFNNEEFLIGQDGLIAYSDNLIRLMDQIEGRNLDVYWLDGSDGKVMKAIVYLRGDDRPICEAISKPAYNRARIERTPIDEANMVAMSKYNASIDGYINSKKRSIDKVTIIDNRTTVLNNKFSIIRKRLPSPELNAETEVLPAVVEEVDMTDMDLTPDKISFKRDLRENF